MMNSQSDGCPDANALATYLDGRSSRAERLAVQQHIAQCHECLDLIAEVMSLTEAGDQERRWAAAEWSRSFAVHGHTVRGLLAVAVVMAATFGSVWWATRITLEPSSLDSAYLSDGRFLEGRLSGATAYRPWTPTETPSTRPVAIQDALTEARTNVDQIGAADRLHAYGVLGALAGDWETAAFALSAARNKPADARFHSDAAAIYIERARQTGRTADLVRALGAAQRALRLDPGLVEARFNRGLALDRLWLRPQAREAWVDYLRRDGVSGWAEEARRRAAALEAPRAFDRWTEIEAALRRSVEPELAEEAIRDHTTEARRFLETVLLPQWAAVASAGTWAAPEREAIRVMADGFARLTGDVLYQDTIRAIDSAEARGRTTLRTLAAAHAGYADAAALLWRDQFAAAEPGLAAAARAFANTGSPFLLRARLDAAVISHYMGQDAAAVQTLEGIALEADRRAYLFVKSRSQWVQGLAAFGAGRYAEARWLWETMLGFAEQMGDAEEQAAAHGLLANLLDHLADDTAAWRHRLEYLKTLSDYRAERIRFGLLISAAGHALREDPAAALTLQQVVLDEAMRARRDGALPEAYAQRAEICASLGWGADATRDMTAAWATWNGLSDPALKARLEPSLRAAEVRVLEALKDPEAGAVADRAIALLLASDERTGLAGLYGALSRSRLRAGRLHEAAASADAGIRALKDVGRGAPLAANGGSDRAGLFEVAMRVALASNDLTEAYAYGSVARSRRPVLEPEPFQKLGDVQRRLTDGEALIALNQLDEELVVWLVKPSDVQFHIVKLTRLESERLVLLQQDEIALETAKPQASAALFRAIVRPFARSLADVDRVAVAPDAPFFVVSFPALFDLASGRFWVEDVDLTVVASTDNSKASAALTIGAVVEVPPNATRDVALALWREARGDGVVQLGVPVAANNRSPELSRIIFADGSGLPYSGAILARDLEGLPPAGAVFLPDIDPGPLATAGAGSFDAARVFLESEIPYVVTSVTAGPVAPVITAELRKHLEANASVIGAVAGFQREVLRSQRRLGTWSHLVVYGRGR